MPASTCRSCGAPLIWAETPNGKLMPLDAKPTATGRWAIVKGEKKAHLVSRAADATEGLDSHYATCPHAGQWRKAK